MRIRRRAVNCGVGVADAGGTVRASLMRSIIEIDDNAKCVGRKPLRSAELMR
jgi:hypothetical protein